MSLIHPRTALELCSMEQPEVDHIVEHLIVRGAITSFSAKIKAGKTTFLAATIRAILHEKEIVGLDTKRVRVLYCTEEGPVSFSRNLRRNHLDSELDLFVVHLSEIQRDMTWPAIVGSITDYCLSNNIDVVIFDTLTRWARLRADQENDAGVASHVMEPLELLRKAMAVVIVFHDRKSGGDLGDSSRGSSAFGGAADIILQLNNPRQNGHANRRYLYSTGRLYEPGVWIMDYESGEYNLVKSSLGYELEDDEEEMPMTVERDVIHDQLLLSLGKGDALTRDQLALDCQTDSKNNTLRKAIKGLVDSGLLIQSGRGVNGDPYVYTMSANGQFTASLE